VLCAEDVLDGAEHAGLAVGCAHDCMPLHVGANEVSCGAVRINVVRSVLGVTFDDDNQRVSGVGAVSDGLNQEADSVVVIGLL
jgi:hypothetical protein